MELVGNKCFLPSSCHLVLFAAAHHDRVNDGVLYVLKEVITTVVYAMKIVLIVVTFLNGAIVTAFSSRSLVFVPIVLVPSTKNAAFAATIVAVIAFAELAAHWQLLLLLILF